MKSNRPILLFLESLVLIPGSYLDLENSLQSQQGYHSDEVCTLYERVTEFSWLLKADTDAAEVMLSGREFHWVITKDF